jgi:hypothetical protein
VFSRAKIDDRGSITAPGLLAAVTTGFAQLAEVCAARSAAG